MTPLEIALLVWAGVVNLAAFLAMGADKGRARSGRWRVRELSLIHISLLSPAARTCWM